MDQAGEHAVASSATRCLLRARLRFPPLAARATPGSVTSAASLKRRRCTDTTRAGRARCAARVPQAAGPWLADSLRLKMQMNCITMLCRVIKSSSDWPPCDVEPHLFLLLRHLRGPCLPSPRPPPQRRRLPRLLPRASRREPASEARRPAKSPSSRRASAARDRSAPRATSRSAPMSLRRLPGRLQPIC